MNPFILPESRRSGVRTPEPLVAPGLGARPTGRELVTKAVAVKEEIPLEANREEVEAPELTMIGPRKERSKEMVARKGPAAPKAAGKSWKFWKRPSRRTQELLQLKEGCEQISHVMGSVRAHLETANRDREALHKTLSPLPLAVDGLRRVGDNQRRTHEILEGLQQCVERTAEKDSVFLRAVEQLGDGVSRMDMVVVGMGRTFSSIERNSKATTAAMEKLAARIEASDRFMESAFSQLKASEKDFEKFVTATSRRSALVTVAICALMTVGITMLAYTLSTTPQAGTLKAPSGAVSAVPGGAGAATFDMKQLGRWGLAPEQRDPVTPASLASDGAAGE